MSIFGGILTYIMLWWVVFLCVLPYGTTPQQSTGEYIRGTERGAPIEVNIKQKILWSCLITFVIWGFLWTLFLYGFLTIIDITTMMP